MPSEVPRAGSVRAKLVVNTILLVSFVALMAPQATRIPVHEWLSFAFIVVLVLHLLFSWNWITNVTRRFVANLRAEVRFNYVWDSALYVLMTAVMISGIVISEAALPALGFPRPRDRFWSVAHHLTSEWLMVMVGIHLAMHWRWLVAAFRRLTAGTLGNSALRSNAAGWWVRPTLILAVVALVVSGATLAIGKTPPARAMSEKTPGRSRGEAKGSRKITEAEMAARRAQRMSERTGAAVGVAPGDSQRRPAVREPGGREVPRPGGVGPKDFPRATDGQRPTGLQQRVLRPGAKISAYMGIPFLLTLAVMGVASRVQRGGAARDPLDETGE